MPYNHARCDPRTGQAAQANRFGYLSYQFPTGVALHGLRLTVSGIVIWASALVACCSTIGLDTEGAAAATISASETTAASAHSGTWAGHRASVWSWAIARDMAHLTARIASTASSASADS